MFTPLPPKPNGIADYSYELLTGLGRDFECIVVVEAGDQGPRAPAGVRILSTVHYLLQEDDYKDFVHIYQIGNNPDHKYILPYLVRRPGIIVLHDPSLHHLMDHALLGEGDISLYVDALEAEHGLAGKLLGEQFRLFGLREEQRLFDMPMIRGLIGPSRGAIVHSKYAEAKVLARVSNAVVTVVPHQFVPPTADLVSRENIRTSLGIDGEGILLVSLGFATKSKRIDIALRALARIRHRMPPFKYVIAGEMRPEDIDLHSIISELGLEEHVTTLGYVEEHRFFGLMRAADIVINLRHPIGRRNIRYGDSCSRHGCLLSKLWTEGHLPRSRKKQRAKFDGDLGLRPIWQSGF